MAKSLKKKVEKKPTEESAVLQSQASAKSAAPALLAFYPMPVAKGAAPAMVNIGAAVISNDHQFFRLGLQFIPAMGGHITLRLTPTASPEVKKLLQGPGLIAFYVMPAPNGQQASITPIGIALAQNGGEYFHLQLPLIPTASGGHIVLRPALVQKAPESITNKQK